jgi:hypothetical protein
MIRPVADDEQWLVEVHLAVVVVGPVVRAAGAHTPVCVIARLPILLLLRSWRRWNTARVVSVRRRSGGREALLLVLHAGERLLVVVLVPAAAAIAFHGALYFAMGVVVGTR